MHGGDVAHVHLRAQRDVEPLSVIRRELGDDEHRRIAAQALFAQENAFKVNYGRRSALADPDFMDTVLGAFRFMFSERFRPF